MPAPRKIIPKADEVCPFCGKDPLFLELAATGFGCVYCGNPSCPVHPEASGYDDVDVSGLSKAKTLWNTRAPSPAVGGEKVRGYDGEGGSTGWCNSCLGRGRIGFDPSDATTCDLCGGSGLWRFPPASVAFAELREKWGDAFADCDPIEMRRKMYADDDAAPPEVTEGEVTTALRLWYTPEVYDTEAKAGMIGEKDRRDMRAALEAFLRGRGKS